MVLFLDFLYLKSERELIWHDVFLSHVLVNAPMAHCWESVENFKVSVLFCCKGKIRSEDGPQCASFNWTLIRWFL